MIYLTGDTHGALYRIDQMEYQCEKYSVSPEDTLIILGDFGYNFAATKTAVEEARLGKLDSLPFKDIFYLDGNHENFERLNSYPTITKYGAKCHRITSKISHILRGEFFVLEGKTFLVLGGAPSIDKKWRYPFIDWWPEEVPSLDEMKKTLKAAKQLIVEGVKFYVLTHEIPEMLLFKYFPEKDLNDPRMTQLKEFLDILYTLVKDNLIHWYFGHFHIDGRLGDATCLYEEMIPLDYELLELPCKERRSYANI